MRGPAEDHRPGRRRPADLSDDGDTAIAFNGEIYNHREIRSGTGGVWATDSTPTATPKRCCTPSWSGTRRVSRACAACSRWRCGRNRSKRLVLARDRMGIKPLYYYRSGEDVYFGSELKAILEHPEVPRQLDLDALDTYLSLNYVPGPADADRGDPKGAARALAGMAAREDVRSERVVEAADGSERGRSRWDAAKEELDWLLRDSVREHLVSDVPLGVWASGGLDSSAILHYAAAQTRRAAEDIFGFVCRAEFRREPVLPRDRADVRHRPSRIRSEPGSGTAERDRGFRVLLRRAERGRGRAAGLVPLADEPAARDGGAFRRRRGRVVRRLSDLSWRTGWCGRSGMVPAGLRRLMRGALDRYMPVSDDKISLEYKLKRWLEGSLLRSGRSAFFLERDVLDRAAGSRSGRARNGNGLRQLVDGLGIAPGGVLNRYLTVDQNYYLPDDILYKTDRMSMAHSLEVRPPFLDHRIVEFAASLPAAVEDPRHARRSSCCGN